MSGFKLGAASKDERIVFGAQRPGYCSRDVDLSEVLEWISFMKGQGIRRVCCLLPEGQLRYYEIDLLKTYAREFGLDNVSWSPVEDYHLCDKRQLNDKILPFLKQSAERGERVVVHCSGGSGRTGHILAAWLIFARGFSIDEALKAVTETGRDPYEAVSRGNATEGELEALFEACRVR